MKALGLRRNTRGAVFVEHLIAYLPVIFFFLATWQLIELCAAHLVVKRAASAAARAAVVVLSDDPAFYKDKRKDEEPHQTAINMAANLILATNPHLSRTDVKTTPAAGSAALTATVTSRFQCFAGWASLVCGVGGARELTAKSTYVYQGASYSYEQ